MNGLQIELSGFRSEMKEFKKAVEKRMDCLDTRSTACQYNPNVCATARRLEEHIKADNGKAGRNMAVIACVISCFNVAVTVLVSLFCIIGLSHVSVRVSPLSTNLAVGYPLLV